MMSDDPMFQNAMLTQAQHQQIARLLLRLGSNENADRWTAQTELRKMAPLPVPVLVAHMARLERVQRQSPFLLFLGLFASCFLLLGLLLVFDTTFGPISRIPVLVAALTTLALMLRRWVRMRAAAIRALDSYNDARQVGPLAQVLAEANGDREMQTVARALLLRLLPRMQQAQAGLLTSEQRGGLLALLATDDTPLLLALLKVLPQWGDEASLSLVRHLAQGKEKTARESVGTEEARPDLANEQVREAAQECLQAMAANRIRQRLQPNLLRVIDSRSNQSQSGTPEAQE
jgi:hypothetical protein